MSTPKTYKVLNLIEQYQTSVSEGAVQFLESDSNKEINGYLGDLYKIFKPLKNKEKEKNKEYDWNKAHESGRQLWKKLVSQALNSIDPNSKGNSTLFEYLTVATKFEDLLYGLEPFYRDHTLHSLWVYFLGDNLLRNELVHIYDQPDWYIYNDIKRDKDKYDFKHELKEYSIIKKEILQNAVNTHKDAIWCIIALCHDLGYSISKLNKLNKSVQNVLKYFDVSDFRRIGYSLDIEHQYLMSQFLELMAMDVRIVPAENYADDLSVKPAEFEEEWGKVYKEWKVKKRKKDDFKKNYDEILKKFSGEKVSKTLGDRVLTKCYRDDSTYWRLSRALEKKGHGILSAYLIYKVLGIFAESSVSGPAEVWGLDDNEAQANIIRGDILFAIAQHEFDFAHLNHIGSFADVLIIADELEEFSRLGRQMLSREYTHTTAETSIKFINKKKGEKIEQGKEIDIEMDYICQHKERDDFLNFFVRKSKKLCSIYSLKLSPEDKDEEDMGKENYCIINKITMTVIWQENENETKEKYWFRLCRESDNERYFEGCLPRYKRNPKTKKITKCVRQLKSYDDKLKVVYRNKEYPLKEFLHIKDSNSDEESN